MNKVKADRLGFSFRVSIIIGVVALLLVILSGFIYKKYETSFSQTPSAAETAKQQDKEASNAQEQSLAIQYIEIKEWGIIIPLSEPVKDAYYKRGLGEYAPNDKTPVKVWLADRTLDGESCDPANNDHGERGALGAILRVRPSEKDPVTEKTMTEEYPNGTLIDGWYYAYQSGKKDNPCATEAQLTSRDAAFAAAIQSASKKAN